MTKKRIFSLFIAALVGIVSFGLCACGDNNNGNGDDTEGNHGINRPKKTVEIVVRDENFLYLTEQVYFDGEVICTSGKQPKNVEVDMVDEAELTTKINLGGTECLTYVHGVENGIMKIYIIKTDKPFEEFYVLNGKTVYAADGVIDGKDVWSGETAAPGVEIHIGENVLPRYGGDERNFDVKMVHKDSIISAYKEGCTFVNRNFEPYNDFCFSERFKDSSDKENAIELTEVMINGQKRQIEMLNGGILEFRLDNRNF